MNDIGKATTPWSPEAPASARKDRRASLFLQAAVAFGGKPPMTLKVRNLSPGGMMIECDTTPPVGTPVMATIRGLEAIAGTVVWIKPKSAGITFDREIDPTLALKPTRRSISPDFLVKPRGPVGRRPRLKAN